MFTTDLTAKVATSWDSVTLRQTTFLLLRLAIGITILVYLAKSGQINFSSFTRLFRVWPITLAATGFLLLDILIMSIRASHGRRAEVATILILDRFVGLFSLVLLPILFAPFFLDLLRSLSVLRRLLYMDALLAGLMVVSVALVTFFASTRSWVARSLGTWPTIKDLAVRVLDAMAVQGKAQSTLFFAFLHSLLANLALIIVTALGLYAVNPLSFSTRLALVAPLGHLVNSLPLTPGGIGVGEIAFNALFKLTGLSGGAEALLCVRLWNIFVGLLGLLVYLFGMHRVVYPYGEESLEAEAEYIRSASTN